MFVAQAKLGIYYDAEQGTTNKKRTDEQAESHDWFPQAVWTVASRAALSKAAMYLPSESASFLWPHHVQKGSTEKSLKGKKD